MANIDNINSISASMAYNTRNIISSQAFITFSVITKVYMILKFLDFFPIISSLDN